MASARPRRSSGCTRGTRRKSPDVDIASVPTDGAFSTDGVAVQSGRDLPRSIETVAPAGGGDRAAEGGPEQVPCTHRVGSPDFGQAWVRVGIDGYTCD